MPVAPLIDQFHIVIAQLFMRRAMDLGLGDPLNPTVFRHLFTVMQFPLGLACRARQSLHTFIALDARGITSESACARLAKRAELCAKVLAEEIQERAHDSRHAGADDANFALDAAPEGDFGVVVGRVDCLLDVREVLQPHHAASGDEQADEERQDDADLALLVLDLDGDKFVNR